VELNCRAGRERGANEAVYGSDTRKNGTAYATATVPVRARLLLRLRSRLRFHQWWERPSALGVGLPLPCVLTKLGLTLAAMLGLGPWPFALARLLGAREPCPLKLGATDMGGVTNPPEGEPLSADIPTLREDPDVLGRDDVNDVKDAEYGLESVVKAGNDATEPDSAVTSLVNGLTSRSSRTGAGLNRASISDSVGRGPYARGRARMSKAWTSFVPIFFESLLWIELLLDCTVFSTGAYRSSACGRVRYTSSCVDSRVATPARISPLGRGGAMNDGGVPTGST